jgi:Flp pilus assembly protein TadD
MRGWIEETAGDYQSAISNFCMAIERKPDIPNTIWLRAVCYEQTGDIDSAITDYMQYLKYKPADEEAYLNLALIYEYKKEYEKAIFFLTECSKLKSSSYEEKIKNLQTTIPRRKQPGYGCFR